MIELTVAVLIIAILAMLGLAQFQKLVEQQRADNATAILASISAANRARLAARKPVVAGPIDENSPLVIEDKIAGTDWDRSSYLFAGTDGNCVMAVAKRRWFGPGGTLKMPYAGNFFCASITGKIGTIDEAGNCSACEGVLVSAPACKPTNCSAPMPTQCGQTNSGTDDCGLPCTMTLECF